MALNKAGDVALYLKLVPVLHLMCVPTAKAEPSLCVNDNYSFRWAMSR